MHCHKVNNLPHVLHDKTIVGCDKSVRSSLHHRRKRAFEVIACAHGNRNQLKTQRRNGDDKLFKEREIRIIVWIPEEGHTSQAGNALFQNLDPLADEVGS